MVSKLRMKAKLIIKKIRNGKIVEQRVLENIITNVGKAQAAGLLNGVVTTPFQYIAIGTGTTAAAATDTALENEIARKSASTSRKTTSVTNDTAVWEASFSSADGLSGSAAITESGLFDSSTGGNMLARRTFDPVNVNWDAGDSIQVTWEIQQQ